MARYRAFERNPIAPDTWFDRGWFDGASQEAVIRQLVNHNEGEFFVVPAKSFLPVRVQRVERVSWTAASINDGDLVLDESDGEESEG